MPIAFKAVHCLEDMHHVPVLVAKQDQLKPNRATLELLTTGDDLICPSLCYLVVDIVSMAGWGSASLLPSWLTSQTFQEAAHIQCAER